MLLFPIRQVSLSVSEVTLVFIVHVCPAVENTVRPQHLSDPLFDYVSLSHRLLFSLRLLCTGTSLFSCYGCLNTDILDLDLRPTGDSAFLLAHCPFFSLCVGCFSPTCDLCGSGLPFLAIPEVAQRPPGCIHYIIYVYNVSTVISF